MLWKISGCGSIYCNTGLVNHFSCIPTGLHCRIYNYNNIWMQVVLVSGKSTGMSAWCINGTWTSEEVERETSCGMCLMPCQLFAPPGTMMRQSYVQCILVHCTNEVVVDYVKSDCSKSFPAMQLLLIGRQETFMRTKRN